MTKNKGVLAPRKYWTAAEESILADLYPDLPCIDIAALLQRKPGSVYQAAARLGLCKSDYFKNSDASGRVTRGKQHPAMIATRFQKGHKTWNAGRKGWQAGGRSTETQFATGQEPPNTLPLGSLRIVKSKTGICQLERKIGTVSGPNHLRWKTVHRLVWEAINGPVPPGHIIVFKPGMKTLVEAEITIDKVDCISRAENARRNDIGSKNPELKSLYQLKGAITRQINRITKEKEKTA